MDSSISTMTDEIRRRYPILRKQQFVQVSFFVNQRWILRDASVSQVCDGEDSKQMPLYVREEESMTIVTLSMRTQTPQAISSIGQASVHYRPTLSHRLMPSLLTAGQSHDYLMPYEGAVQHDPTFEEMRYVVVGQKFRPLIPTHWSNHQVREIE